MTLRFCVAALSIGLGGCVYFNTYYNADKAYADAVRMHDKRLDKNPEDSVLATPEEKLKLERAITKASKVLELYPDKKKYQPKSLFIIGESYLAEGEYTKAMLKYEELARFYPDAQEIPTADFHHAKCVFMNGQFLAARPELEKIMNTSPVPDYRREAMALLAKLELGSNSPQVALDLYEKLLREQAHTPEARANAHFEAAKLAFDLKQWERARGHAKDKDIKYLPTKLRYRCDMLSAECLFNLNRVQAGVDELLAMKRNRLYAASIPEMDIKLAQGYFLLNNPDKAVELLKGVPKQAPKTAFSAEAFYRLGEHQLRDIKDEKQAKIFFDSAAAAGTAFEYGALGAERSAALARLTDLRKPADTTAKETHYRDFMIAELFLFKLETVDSALKHLDRIVADPRQDSSHSMRAAYARAFIQDEFKKSKPTSDSLYRYVLEKYPNTEYAKQAERNLGLKPTVQTDEDKAHKLFLEAEAMRFGGGDLRVTVIPAYAKVVSAYPRTQEAAKAQFAIAMIYDQLNQGEEKVAGSLDSAIAAYQTVREDYRKTPFGDVAQAKLAAANIKPRPKPSPAAPSVKVGLTPAGSAPAGATAGKTTAVPGAPAAKTSAAPGAPAKATAPGAPAPQTTGTSAAAPSAPGKSGGAPPAPGAAASVPANAPVNGASPGAAATEASSPAAAPAVTPAPAAAPSVSPSEEPPHHRGMGRHAPESTPAPETASTPAQTPTDTASAPPEGKTKEELDNDYENVDQY